MPANPKYLTQSRSQRFAKISAAILGGFLASASFHLAWAACITEKKIVWASYSYSLFLSWCTLMLLAFLFENGWKCWAWYGGTAVLFSIITLIGMNS